jgi:hypothetical protein
MDGKSCRKNVPRSDVVGVGGVAVFDASEVRLSLSVVLGNMAAA